MPALTEEMNQGETLNRLLDLVGGQLVHANCGEILAGYGVDAIACEAPTLAQCSNDDCQMSVCREALSSLQELLREVLRGVLPGAYMLRLVCDRCDASASTEILGNADVRMPPQWKKIEGRHFCPACSNVVTDALNEKVNRL